MLGNSRGNAIIEIIPILAIFILILNFSLGFFGLIHSGIMNSIAARNYTFETFRNRANLRYLRDVSGSDATFTYTKSQVRYHGIKKERSDLERFVATRRPIKFSEVRTPADEQGKSEHTKYGKIIEGQRVSEADDSIEGSNTPWIKSVYGICLVASCGG